MFVLPLPRRRPSSLVRTRPAGRRRLILLVDDAEDLRTVLTGGLEQRIPRRHGRERPPALRASSPSAPTWWYSISGCRTSTASSAGAHPGYGRLAGPGPDHPHVDRDKLKGFRLDADDYVTKPCSNAELTARITALLRRADAPGQPSRYCRTARCPSTSRRRSSRWPMRRYPRADRLDVLIAFVAPSRASCYPPSPLWNWPGRDPLTWGQTVTRRPAASPPGWGCAALPPPGRRSVDPEAGLPLPRRGRLGRQAA